MTKETFALDAGTIALIISIATLLILATVVAVYYTRKQKVKGPQEEDTNDSLSLETKEESPDLSVALANAASIELFPSSDHEGRKTSLLFERATLTEPKQYKEIIINESSLIGGTGIRTVSALGQQVLSIQQLAMQAPNGLFAATINSAKLTFKSKMYNNNKKIEYKDQLSPVMIYYQINQMLDEYLKDLDPGKINKIDFEKIIIHLIYYTKLLPDKFPKDINKFLFYCLGEKK